MNHGECQYLDYICWGRLHKTGSALILFYATGPRCFMAKSNNWLTEIFSRSHNEKKLHKSVGLLCMQKLIKYLIEQCNISPWQQYVKRYLRFWDSDEYCYETSFILISGLNYITSSHKQNYSTLLLINKHVCRVNNRMTVDVS